jgi:uncharacterized protein (TIGR02246 family)
MSTDEQAIRDLVASWHRATAAGDVETVLTLMAEDVVFLVAGHPPTRGRNSFERGLRGVLSQNRIESTCEIQEIAVSGDLAYCWTALTVRIVPIASGTATVRTGNALHSSQASERIMGTHARRKYVVGGIMIPNHA